mmetsp:Transcript_65593/g.116759  ORF Transcript_65593/g.116759 Transcript_65593/m.116759 type:complete len:95 (+) Transcript_65593:676-960(+)
MSYTPLYTNYLGVSGGLIYTEEQVHRCNAHKRTPANNGVQHGSVCVPSSPRHFYGVSSYPESVIVLLCNPAERRLLHILHRCKVYPHVVFRTNI